MIKELLKVFSYQIWILVFFYIYSVQSQLIYTDKVPFVFYSKILVKSEPDSSTLDFSSKNFQSVPEVIVGIQSYYSNKRNADGIISFHLGVSNVSQKSCQISILNNKNILEISASVLAIDKSSFPYIRVIRQFKENFFQGSDIEFNEERKFSEVLSKEKGTKNVIAVLNGWNGVGGSIVSISIQAQIIDDEKYQIKIKKLDAISNLKEVSYTIVEYVNDPDNLYSILSYADQQYTNAKGPSDPIFSPTAPNRHVETTFQIPLIQNIQIPQNDYQNIFIAFNKLHFLQNPQLEGYPNIELTDYNINNINNIGQFTFSYYVKKKAKFQGVTSTSIFFYERKCLYSYQKMQGNECINDCININPNKPLFCLDCKSGQYFLQDLKICQLTQPPSPSYTCYPEKNYQTCVSCYSINYCQKCQRISGEIMCNECESNYYVYKNTCQIYQISQSVVTDSTKAAIAISVVSSAQGGSSFMFLTLQKLNLLYMVNILFTPELTVFINQIKGTNPMLYFQKINFFSKHIFVESSEQIEDQFINDKVGQTSLLINGGGIVVSIIITLILFSTMVLVNKYLRKQIFSFMQLTKLQILSKCQMISCLISFKINELTLLVTSYAIFLQIIGFTEQQMQIYKAIKIIVIIILGVYQLLCVIYQIHLIRQSKNQSIHFSEEINSNVYQISYKNHLTNLLLEEYIPKKNFTNQFPILFFAIENFLIPLSIIIFHKNYYVQLILSLIFQLVLFTSCIILRPFVLFLNNLRLIIDQLCWVLILIFMICLGVLQENSDKIPEENVEAISRVSTTLRILMVIALYINPLIQIINLLISLYKFIIDLYQKYQQKKRKTNLENNRDLLSDTYLDIKLFKIPQYDPKKELIFIKRDLNAQYGKYLIQKNSFRTNQSQISQIELPIQLSK